MVTAGMDARVRVWDVRTFKPIHSYFSASPATALDISQRGLLAVGYGPHVQVRPVHGGQRPLCLLGLGTSD
jgi:U3 small nucleolar RNA-associated protein 7